MKNANSEILKKYPSALLEESQDILINLWEKDLKNAELPLTNSFLSLIRYIISNADYQGVLFGSVEELAKNCNIPLHQARKYLRVLVDANLLKRKNGITLIIDTRWHEKNVSNKSKVPIMKEFRFPSF